MEHEQSAGRKLLRQGFFDVLPISEALAAEASKDLLIFRGCFVSQHACDEVNYVNSFVNGAVPVFFKSHNWFLKKCASGKNLWCILPLLGFLI